MAIVFGDPEQPARAARCDNVRLNPSSPENSPSSRCKRAMKVFEPLRRRDARNVWRRRGLHWRLRKSTKDSIMSDPRDPYTDNPNVTRRPTIADSNRSMPWVWIAGGVAVVLLILVFAFGTGTDQTATGPTTTPQTETTGEAPATPPPGGMTGQQPASPPAATEPATPPAAAPEPATPPATPPQQ
jgi:hypothetical protein